VYGALAPHDLVLLSAHAIVDIDANAEMSKSRSRKFSTRRKRRVHADFLHFNCAIKTHCGVADHTFPSIFATPDSTFVHVNRLVKKIFGAALKNPSRAADFDRNRANRSN
jgi:hypothetical protein